jgi:chromate transporter
VTEQSPIAEPLPPEAREPWRSFLRSMFRVGVNSFGGPVAQIGFMHDEAVVRRRWLTDAQFVQLLNFANVLPGPEALEIAIHLGYLRRGIAGGIVAGLLFIWPGYVSLTALGWAYVEFGEVRWLQAFFEGLRPLALGLLAAAVIRLSTRTLHGAFAVGIAAGACAAKWLFDAPFLAVLGVAALIGVLLARWRGALPRAAHGLLMAAALAGGAGFALAIADPPPSPGRTPIETERRARGAPSPTAGRLGEVAWLNARAAMITFGGAYTALPFFREQAVERYQWMTDAQMLDALALGETTPGPLISVGVFISYLASGFSGATVGAFCLFLPSFVLVLGLARHVGRILRLPRAHDALWGISAATIGLVVALSAQVAPSSIRGWHSVAIAAAVFVAVWRLGASILLLALVIGGVSAAWAALT